MKNRVIKFMSIFLVICILEMQTAVAQDISVNAGTPKNLTIEKIFDKDLSGRDVVSGLIVKFSHDERFLKLVEEKDDSGSLYHVSFGTQMRIDGGKWFDFGNTQYLPLSKLYDEGKSVEIFNFKNATPDTQSKDFESIKPALLAYTNAAGDRSYYFDPDRKLIEVRISYKIYAVSQENYFEGEWSDICGIGKIFTEGEITSFKNPPLIFDMSLRKNEQGLVQTAFKTIHPPDMSVAVASPGAQVMYYLEVRYDNEEWLPLDFALVSQMISDGSHWYTLPPGDDGKNADISSTKIELRMNYGWYAGKAPKNHGEKAALFSSVFSDVISAESWPKGEVSAWAVSDLKIANEIGIVPKSIKKERNLTSGITRIEFAALCVKTYEVMSGKKVEVTGENPFKDTSDQEILKAYSLGIVRGKSDTLFCPDELLTRQEASAMLMRVYKKHFIKGWSFEKDSDFKLSYEVQKNFLDDENISQWAKESVYFMSANGIIFGVGENRFSPLSTTSREQAVVIALRMVNKF